MMGNLQNLILSIANDEKILYLTKQIKQKIKDNQGEVNLQVSELKQNLQKANGTNFLLKEEITTKDEQIQKIKIKITEIIKKYS